MPVWQKREYTIALMRIVDGARAQAAVSEGLRTQLEKETSDYNFPLERKFAFPLSLQVLDEITKLLPDDTWLTQMEVKTQTRGKDTQRELLMRGESGNAGRLITLFEESKVFTQAAPRSPATKIQPGPGEIFDLAAQLRPRPKPAPLEVVAAPSAAVPAAVPGSAAAPTPQAAPVPDGHGWNAVCVLRVHAYAFSGVQDAVGVYSAAGDEDATRKARRPERATRSQGRTR